MDDFGNEIWLVQEESGNPPDSMSALWSIMMFYGMVHSYHGCMHVFCGEFIDIKDNLP
jgi:hypothetical protein